MRGQPGFWDVDERYVRLSEAGDPLEKLNAIVPFEVFRKPLAKALRRSDGAKGGRPPYDAVLMFKILVLQALYNLSDDQAEFQIQDRLSFMRFLGLGMAEKVPDAKTIWLFREHLAEAGAIKTLFSRFDEHLARAGYLAMGGQIVDATIVAAPKQRNTEDEKAAIKAGEVPEAWKDKPAKLGQKDRDARWTVKFSKAKPAAEGKAQHIDIAVPAFGYKNHASIDRRHGFIRGWSATSAAAWDGAQLANVLDRSNTGSKVWADTAYRSAKNEAWLDENGYVSDIHRKKPKGRAMSERTSRANGRRSKVRSAVEHVFARQKGPMKLFIRTIGIVRAEVKIGMANLAYNLTRFVWHQGRGVPA
ncbi:MULTISPECIES: IS5 family transposase [unclassified Aureimonas]|uniref:IS5 family transposase n=1 Tax=unclassified Aureimonas TaxID=2615206 RepID=UPI0006FFE7CB|nr:MULTISPECIES: IS5 family transposase [unclassified Aureimonas]KQT63316.1 transposase [Aureimonas sp. Leaf427]KQT80105.1 transposase [Aureimonas sp. Leaf460]